MNVQVQFNGEDPLELPGPPVQHFRRLHSLQVEVSGDDKVKGLVEADDGWPLLSLMVRIGNRVVGAVRNFGTVACLEPLRVSSDDTNKWLRVLHVTASDDGETWNPGSCTWRPGNEVRGQALSEPRPNHRYECPEMVADRGSASGRLKGSA